MLDHNLSPRLVRRLGDLDPGSVHVRQLNLQAADDEAVWRHAQGDAFTIITKDDDFRAVLGTAGSGFDVQSVESYDYPCEDDADPS